MNIGVFESNIPGILLMSHGPLCQALLESAKMLGGEAANVVALPLFENADIEAYGAEAMAIYRSMPQGSIVLFDLAGGTPFNQMLMKSNGESFSGMCGVNLPILMEALALRESLQGDALIDALMESASMSIVNLKGFFMEL